jgi:hypothetical protein
MALSAWLRAWCRFFFFVIDSYRRLPYKNCGSMLVAHCLGYVEFYINVLYYKKITGIKK